MANEPTPQPDPSALTRADDAAVRVHAALQQLQAPGSSPPSGAAAMPNFAGLAAEFLADLNLTAADVATLKGLPPKVVQAIIRMAVSHGASIFGG